MGSARHSKYLNEAWSASTDVMEGSVLGLWRGRLSLGPGSDSHAWHGPWSMAEQIADTTLEPRRK